MPPLKDEYYNFILQGSGPDYPPITIPLERRIAYQILHDMTDRRGLRQQWEQIDEDIQEEIIARWIELVSAELNAQEKEGSQ